MPYLVVGQSRKTPKNTVTPIKISFFTIGLFYHCFCTTRATLVTITMAVVIGHHYGRVDESLCAAGY